MTPSSPPHAPNPKSQIGIVAVDDIPLILDAIELAIQNHPEITFLDRASNSREAITIFTRHRSQIDVAIVDLNLKEKQDAGPYELCKQLNELFPGIPLLAFTIYDGQTLIQQLRKIGVKGYLSKNFQRKELVSAIKELASGGEFFPPPQKGLDSVLGIDFSTANIEPDLYQKITLLTNRELEVVHHMTSGLTINEIADILTLSPHTINIHRNNIFRKLEVKSAHQLTALLKGKV